MNVKDLKSGQVFELSPEVVFRKFSKAWKLHFIVERKVGNQTVAWYLDPNALNYATRVKMGSNTTVYNPAIQDWIQEERRRKLIELILKNKFKDETK
jgi:hypothetical protein